MASALAAGGAFAVGPGLLRRALAADAVAGEGPYGPLQAPNEWGMQLPSGFTGRRIARGGDIVGGYPWHFASDGQATYRTGDGGFVLVSNSEAPAVLGGGASAIRFGPDGRIRRAYRILLSNMNCAGGPTPWGTWLSCEEHPAGLVWEADPAGVLPAQPRPALGNFAHEATATDPVHGHVYLTEDEGDGCFYRFRPDAYPSLLAGVLEVAEVAPDGGVSWHRVPDPNLVTAGAPTRNQVPQATRFDGGEGLWYDGGVVYFTTKGDKKVWAYDTGARALETVFDRSAAPDASLDAVDNVTVSAAGDIYVCEDGGNMEIGLIAPGEPATVSPFVRLVGDEHAGSEMCGVVFDPSQTRMYFSSQRAYPVVGGTPAALGAIYEVTGPFRLPAPGVVAAKAYGPPAGETLGPPSLPDALSVPGLEIEPIGGVRRRRLRERGLRVSLRLEQGAEVRAVLRTFETRSRKFDRWFEARPVPVTLAAVSARRSRGRGTLVLRPRRRALRQLRARKVRAVLTVVARTRDGELAVASDVVRVTR